MFYAETSLTRWGGGLENYGAAYTFFQYLWEQAGGNGDGTYTPDLQYDGAGGDLLIKRIFENQADGMDGVQAAIDQFNAETGATLRDVKTLYQDWAVAVYLDDEESEHLGHQGGRLRRPHLHDVDDGHRRRPVLGAVGAATRALSPTPSGIAARTASPRPLCRTASRSSGSATPDRT